MRPSMLGVKNHNGPASVKTSRMDYMATVNHPQFKEANSLVFEAEMALTDMGMSKEEARGWIIAWASGAGDGSE